MSQIKKFVDRIALAEARQNREIIMPLSEAKELRDDILKLLIDLKDKPDGEVIEVVMRGNKF